MMKSLLYKLKSLYYAGAAMKDMKKYALEMQLGHSKIIGWDGGHPVNSLLFPPEYSQPMIRSRARFYNSLRFGNPSPVVANIAVTARCRCSCPHCSSAGQDATDMPAKKWRDIIRQCQELGVFTIVITGGEPLERPDLEQIISAVDQSISLPVLFTCGMGLADRLEGLLASGLKRIYVSLDYADSTGHNGHRGVDGLFEQAVNGLKAARAMGMLTGISTYASPTRLADGTLDSLITLARDLPVNELLIWDEMPVGRYAGNPDIAPLGSPYYAELQRFVDGRQKETRDIGIWSYQRMRSYSGSGCMAGVSTFEVAADGGVQPCDFCRTCIGNVNEKPLLDLWHALTVLAAGRRSRHHGCWILNDMAEKRSSR